MKRTNYNLTCESWVILFLTNQHNILKCIIIWWSCSERWNNNGEFLLGILLMLLCFHFSHFFLKTSNTTKAMLMFNANICSMFHSKYLQTQLILQRVRVIITTPKYQTQFSSPTCTSSATSWTTVGFCSTRAPTWTMTAFICSDSRR